MAVANPKTKKAPGLAKLKNNLDAIFSKYIRLSHADDDGFCTCYTCGNRLHWTKIQNGHLFSRGRLSTRFDPDNCRPQCYGCNVAGKGNYQEYFPRMLREIGPEKLEELERKSKEFGKITTMLYQVAIEVYTEKVKKLKLEKGAF